MKFSLLAFLVQKLKKWRYKPYPKYFYFHYKLNSYWEVIPYVFMVSFLSSFHTLNQHLKQQSHGFLQRFSLIIKKLCLHYPAIAQPQQSANFFFQVRLFFLRATQVDIFRIIIYTNEASNEDSSRNRGGKVPIQFNGS